MSKNIEKQYLKLLKDILENGVEKQDRTGTGTISVFGRQIRHDMSKGFPLLTTKKMYWKGIVTELLWFLRGDTNIKYLVDNDCHIWDGDAYKAYEKAYEDGKHLEGTGLLWMEKETKETFIYKIKTDDKFAKKWGELGPVYGKQWRSWVYYRKGLKHNDTEWDYHTECGEGELDNIGEFRVFDQIANLIEQLKINPDSRRLMVSAWNVGELDKMTLPPCHYGFQVYTRELSFAERRDLAQIYAEENNKLPLAIDAYGREGIPEYMDTIDNTGWNIPKRAISLMFNMRSNDVPLGLPFNIASYALLLEIIGKIVNMVPDELIANLGDAHIYKNQVNGVKEQLAREPYPLPKLNIIGYPDEYHDPYSEMLFDEFNVSDFELENYQSHPIIKIPLSN